MVWFGAPQARENFTPPPSPSQDSLNKGGGGFRQGGGFSARDCTDMLRRTLSEDISEARRNYKLILGANDIYATRPFECNYFIKNIEMPESYDEMKI